MVMHIIKHLQLIQPPSGGCVLKHLRGGHLYGKVVPAAFGRLCVETCNHSATICAASPAAFRRLCVETFQSWPKNQNPNPSRLQAAVC